VNKNNWDELLGKGLKSSLGQSEGGGTGRRRVGIKEQTVEGNGPK